MTKEQICQALKDLRDSKPELRNYAQFTRATGIHRPTVEKTELGLSVPGVEIIKKWVNACGKTLSQFFAQLEEQPVSEDSVRIVFGYEHYYKLLTAIIESGSTFYRNAIEGNLYGMQAASGAPLPPGVPAPPNNNHNHSPNRPAKDGVVPFTKGEKTPAVPPRRGRHRLITGSKR